MIKHRDLLKEIQEKRKRFPYGSDRFEEFIARIEKITASHDAIMTEVVDTDVKTELLRYIPISLVSALEGYFRAVVRDLVDSDSVFLERAEKFKDLKIPLNIITAVHGKKLSLGEFISHSIPFSNLEDINKNLSIFLNLDFFDVMRNAEFNIGVDRDSLLAADDDLFAGIAKTYELRNIYCHEMALAHEATQFDAIWGLFTADAFVGYSEIMTMAELNKARN
jgi:hypothetical protein